MRHVISTLAADTRYTNWVNNAGLNMPDHSVLVRGGAGVAHRGSGDIWTPDGLRTEVSDEDAAWLAKHPHFIEHQKKGFVKIVDKPLDANKAAQTMADNDGSRPKTEADVKADAEKAAAEVGLKPEETLQVTTNSKKK